MSAAPLLAALLGAALPGLRALDIGLPAPPRLLPWLPGALCGVSGALPPAEAALLRRFRHPDGRPVVGLDLAADAALLAGAPAAWSDAPERLARLAVPTADLPADALLLVPAGADGPPSRLPCGRVLLLLGAGEAVERDDLLVPVERLEAIRAALQRAAEALAGAAGGRWLSRAQAISPEMASVALLPEEGQTFRPPVRLPASALVHDLPSRARADGLDLSDARHARLLLGASPARARVFLRGEVGGVALFGDGQRLAATRAMAPSGETCLEADMPPGASVAVLGLTWTAPARLALVGLELLP